MGYKEILDYIQNKSVSISDQGFSFVADQFGLDTSTLQVKLLIIVGALLVIYVASKITNKLAKFGLIIVGILLLISMFAGFF